MAMNLSAAFARSRLRNPKFMNLFLLILARSQKASLGAGFKKIEKTGCRNFWKSSSITETRLKGLEKQKKLLDVLPLKNIYMHFYGPNKKWHHLNQLARV